MVDTNKQAAPAAPAAEAAPTVPVMAGELPPAIPGEAAPATPPPAKDDEAVIEVMGQKFHNLKHLERVLGETLSKAKQAETELNAIKMREVEAQKEQVLMDKVRKDNPTLDDEALRRQVESIKMITSDLFSEERENYRQQAGFAALGNYVRQNSIPDDVAEGIVALYSIPEMAKLIHTKDKSGDPIMSFNDLKDWAEAPSLRRINAELKQKLESIENGTIAAGAGSGGGAPRSTPPSSKEPPVTNDYEAIKKWRRENVL